MGDHVEFEMGERRGAPVLSIQGEGTPTTSTLVVTSTFEQVGASTIPPCPSTIAPSTGLIMAPQDFLQH